MEYVILFLGVAPVIMLVISMFMHRGPDRVACVLVTKVAFALCYGTLIAIMYNNCKMYVQ